MKTLNELKQKLLLLEISEIEKSWWKRFDNWIKIFKVFIPIMITFVSYYFAQTTGFIDKIKIQHQKEKMVLSRNILKLTAKKDSLKTTVYTLTADIRKLQKENKDYLEIKDELSSIINSKTSDLNKSNKVNELFLKKLNECQSNLDECNTAINVSRAYGDAIFKYAYQLEDSLNKCSEKFHIVQSGETIYSIAKKNNIFIDKLISLNPELSEEFIIGMRLKVKE